MDGLYERDALAWAEQQADLLRRVAAGERVNSEVDWPHVIEEIHDVGLSQLNSVESLLQLAMIHLLKLQLWPGSDAARHWRVEAGIFLDDAGRRFSPSMLQRIDLDKLYATARKRALAAGDLDGTAALPASCPFALDGLLAGEVEELVTVPG